MSIHASSVEIISVVPNAPPGRAGADSSTTEHADKQSEMPMPRDWQSFALTAILVLLVLVVLYFSGEVILPILFAFLLNLLLQPAMNALIKVHVPKTMAALFIILLFVGAVAGIVFSLSGPATAWIAKAPESIARLEERLSAITLPVAIFQKASQDVEKFAGARAATRPASASKGRALGACCSAARARWWRNLPP